MNNWEKSARLEDAYEEMHSIRPSVEYKREDKNKYNIRLKYKDKEIILSEVMERGLTKYAYLEYNGKTEQFKTYFEAEKRANEILRSKDGSHNN